ncbi:BBP7 family outer membrane beta-barrel protein [Roseiconus nitratireducens]|uniref:BBP7 family outer membrane beta-barrel protein n=1 Tax=Roseiconus nitratireducens TaxID=2605748 RepID=A0A5M6D5L5_9BACT|nr:BBP7 family outer membrane beta-barrel protein [Roseiconus nitratireducens]KAA5540495.1 BBP7 family outer membrane beta-barrel protein [Roseiconus nitratireducens]
MAAIGTFWASGGLAPATLWGQVVAPPVVVTSPTDPAAASSWGDPYQIPTTPPLAPAGGLFNGPIFGAPAATTSTGPTALNAPMMAAPIQGDGRLLPIFDGGPLSNTFTSYPPLLPRVSEHIDSRLYFRGEYLLWDVSGMDSPSLVTTSPGGTPQATAGVLGETGTSTRFGNTELNDGSASGFLLGSGFWISPERRFGVETEYFWLEDMNDGFSASSDGSPILARPFFDIVAGQQTAQLLAYPGLVSGNVRVGTESSLRSFLINGRFALCQSPVVPCQPCEMQDRTDWILGYRNLRLRDSLAVSENLQSELETAPGSVSLSDSFETTNQFQGLQLGVVRRTVRNQIWLESSIRVALGNNEQTLRTDGSTSYTESGVTDVLPGGLLVQRTNSGTFRKDEFVMIPELGLRLGLRLTTRLHASIGYTVLYFPNVIRASEQIDTDVNPGLIPDELDPLEGALRPRTLWVQSDYLAHGLTIGGEFRF